MTVANYINIDIINIIISILYVYNYILTIFAIVFWGKYGENMATVNYIQKGKTETVYLRFRHRDIDISTSTQIYVNNKFWDKKNQKIKNTIHVPERDSINEILALLKLHIINKFNIDYANGEIIDRKWLDDIINQFYKRPDEDELYKTFLSDYCSWWLEHKASKHKGSNGEIISKTIINHYTQVYENLINYEDINGKVRFKDINSDFLDSFADYLVNVEMYAASTVKRRISRIKFFCSQAENDDIEVHRGYMARVHVPNKGADYKHPYLNTDEINKIFEYKTNDKTLIATRDNWIIGLWTGLRISDFLTRLEINNIQDDFIEIKTKKTGINVAIPLHPQVKEILKRYGNNLPQKISEQEFNRNLKIIAKDLGFNQKMIGGVSKLNSQGKVRMHVGEYHKWELMTSHICRRSFCTNLFGKVPNQVIMQVAGWTTESQMLDYVKQTNREAGEILKEYWYEKENKN